VPDTYQGTEEWSLSLVDPDNRRPVEYARLREDLRGIREALATAAGGVADFARSLVDAKEDGRVKLYLTHRALDCRRRRASLFRAGAYVPLEPQGARREHVVAFARRLDAEAVIAVAPRFLARLRLPGPPLGAPAWAGTWLALPETWAPRRYRNALTDEIVEVEMREGRPALALEALLRSFPTALLETVEEP
jgi:(1->4)-alpha-D-glucan 1-alpha-D-glucosylmutase